MMGGFAVLPDDVTRTDIEDEICWLENGEECIDSNYVRENGLMHISLAPVSLLDILYECQNRTGIFAADISLRELSGYTYKSMLSLGPVFSESAVCSAVKPDTKRDICRVLSSAHSTVEAIKNGGQFTDSVQAMFESETFGKYPFIEREDFFIYLVDNGVYSEDALAAYRYFRLGRSDNEKFGEALEKYNFPAVFYEAVRQCKYLFPKYHNAAYLYIYLLLAKYSKQDRKVYMSAAGKFSHSKA